MSDGPVRVAGDIRLADGSTVVWTVAEGRRGRRWREVRTGVVGFEHSLLLETDPDGRFTHLELATTSLLTLHPEFDGTLHGNIVVGDDAFGVRPIEGEPWDEAAMPFVEGSIVCLAAAAHLQVERIGPFHSDRMRGAWITAALWFDVGAVRVERIDERNWRFDGAEIEIDADGLPILPGGRTWPLE